MKIFLEACSSFPNSATAGHWAEARWSGGVARESQAPNSKTSTAFLGTPQDQKGSSGSQPLLHSILHS